MASRHKKSNIFQNRDQLYQERLKAKKINSINQYQTLRLRYPTPEEAESFIIHTHIWRMGDSYSKLADKYYGDPKMWWVIAHFNQKPMEGDLYYGQQVFIAEPLGALLNSYGV